MGGPECPHSEDTTQELLDPGCKEFILRNIKPLHSLSRFSKLRWCRLLWSPPVENKDLFITNIEVHGCWCSGDARRPYFNSNDTGLVVPEYSAPHGNAEWCPLWVFGRNWCVTNKLHHVWGLWYQKQVSQAGISNGILQYFVGCNYLSLPVIRELFRESATTEHDILICICLKKFAITFHWCLLLVSECKQIQKGLVPMILTHWGRVTHICIGKQTIIGSNNGLSPERRQAITWTNAGILLIGPLGTNFSEILIEIQTFSLKEIHLKMSSAKCYSFRLGLNVLMILLPRYGAFDLGLAVSVPLPIVTGIFVLLWFQSRLT